MYYFLTNDIYNPRLEYIIESLEDYCGNEIIILNNQNLVFTNSFGKKNISSKYRKLNSNVFFIFKLAFFISKISLSKFDTFFYKRNVYSFQFIRPIVNLLWKFKLKLNSILPIYNDVVFSFFKPHEIYINNQKINEGDVFFIDSLLFRNADLIREIKWLSLNSKLISVVVSFDNPIYTQITTRCDKLLVWSEQMLHQLIKFHPYLKKNLNNIEIVNSFLFNPIKKRIDKITVSTNSNDLNVGYGCMFCDHYMLKFEIEMIIYISKILKNFGMKLLVRPYPSLNIKFYKKLFEISNIHLIRSTNSVKKRHKRDGLLYDEVLESKINFLKSCNWFLSLGTSLTIEAALCNLKILQIDLKSRTRFWEQVNMRNALNDHIKSYYSKFIVFDETTDFRILNKHNFKLDNLNLLDKLGIYEN